MWKIGIVGASGYAGGELIRLLARHSKVKIEALASRTFAGQPLGNVFPSLALPDLPLNFVRPEQMENCDLIFLAVPHGVAGDLAPEFLRKGQKVIDIGADFRLKDLGVYSKWYGLAHKAPELVPEAVYGLPEIYREQIKTARLVGNPGCYPTSAILALAPLLETDLNKTDSIIIQSLSGVSGAGRQEGAAYHFPHCASNLSAYKVGNHRHTPEIEQELSALAGRPLKVSFLPHLVPAIRGILTTITVDLSSPVSTAELTDLYKRFYAREYFIRVLGPEQLPQTNAVLGSNFCELAIRFDPRVNRAVIIAAIDNLGKGAASQGIQNLNLMAGWAEKTGIDQPAIYP